MSDADFDVRSPIEFISKNDERNHCQRLPELRNVEFEQLNLKQERDRKTTNEYDEQEARYLRIIGVNYGPGFITEVEINDELRVRLAKAERGQREMRDEWGVRLMKAEDQAQSWKECANDMRKLNEETMKQKKAAEKRVKFLEHVVKRRNEEVQRLTEENNELKELIAKFQKKLKHIKEDKQLCQAQLAHFKSCFPKQLLDE